MYPADRILDVELRLEAERDIGGVACNQEVVWDLVRVSRSGAHPEPGEVRALAVEPTRKPVPLPCVQSLKRSPTCFARSWSRG